MNWKHKCSIQEDAILAKENKKKKELKIPVKADVIKQDEKRNRIMN